MPDPTPTPQGVVAILTAPDGHVVATASNFDTFRPAGLPLEQCQEDRARKALARATVEDTCATYISPALNQYDCERILDALCDKHRDHKPFRVTVRFIGYDDAD